MWGLYSTSPLRDPGHPARVDATMSSNLSVGFSLSHWRTRKNKGVRSQVWKWHTSPLSTFYWHMDDILVKEKQENMVYLCVQEKRTLMGLGKHFSCLYSQGGFLEEAIPEITEDAHSRSPPCPSGWKSSLPQSSAKHKSL